MSQEIRWAGFSKAADYKHFPFLLHSTTSCGSPVWAGFCATGGAGWEHPVLSSSSKPEWHQCCQHSDSGLGALAWVFGMAPAGSMPPGWSLHHCSCGCLVSIPGGSCITGRIKMAYKSLCDRVREYTHAISVAQSCCSLVNLIAFRNQHLFQKLLFDKVNLFPGNNKVLNKHYGYRWSAGK